MLTKSATIILGIIQEHPINAYELIKVLSTFRIKDWYEIADSSVYATLKSLEKKNYIIGETQKSGNMPDKTVYSLTSSGKTELKKTIKNFIVEAQSPVFPRLKRSRCRSSQEVNDSPTPFPLSITAKSLPVRRRSVQQYALQPTPSVSPQAEASRWSVLCRYTGTPPHLDREPHLNPRL